MCYVFSDKPESATIETSHRVVSVDQDFTLTCVTKDPGYPVANYFSWFLGDTPLQSTDTNTFTLPWTREIVLNITCFAENDFGATDQSPSISIYVEGMILVDQELPYHYT